MLNHHAIDERRASAGAASADSSDSSGSGLMLAGFVLAGGLAGFYFLTPLASSYLAATGIAVPAKYLGTTFGAAAGYAAFLVSKTFGIVGTTTYTDQKGVEWQIWEKAPNFWSVASDGYGARWSLAKGGVDGYVSYKQAVDNIEGNAASRDPKTGNIL